MDNHTITPRVNMRILHPDLGPVRILDVSEDDKSTFIHIEDNKGKRYYSFWNELRENPKLEII